MKSIMQSDYVLPKKGFFSNHSYAHSLVNPLNDNTRPQPRRYDPREVTETVTWTKPDHENFETSYRAAYKDTSSSRIQGRTTERNVIPDRNLSSTLIPKVWPKETKRKNVAHHLSGINGRDFREVPKPYAKQYPHVKYADSMSTTTIGFSDATLRHLSPARSPISTRSRSPIDRHPVHHHLNGSNVLRAIYINRSDLAEHIRETHEDAHLQTENIVNRELLKEEFHQYNKIFGGRAGHSSITQRLQTVEPKKKSERRDVSSARIKKLMDNSYANEKDYKLVDKDFKYAYRAPNFKRHPVMDNYYDDTKIERNRAVSQRIMAESRARTPNHGRQSTLDSSRGGRSATPNKSSAKKSAEPMSIQKLIRKHK